MEDNEARLKSIQAAIDAIEKDFGKGSVVYMGETENKINVDVEVISTGSIALDAALGIGGIPRGRVTEIYGAESGGKTTMALHIIANAQKDDGMAAFIDVEHALSIDYAKALGVQMDKLYVSQPDNGEQALEIIEKLVKSKSFSVIVLDSVAALVPKTELEGDMGDSHMGVVARLMSQAMRKLTPCISESNTACIFINQLRDKIGVMYGSNETTTGGRALKFYASVRLDIRRTSQITVGDEITGGRTKVKVAKNKLATPFKVAEFDITYGEGISKLGELVDLGVAHKIVTKSASWYSYGDTRMGQGIEGAKRFFKENPTIADEVEAKIRERLQLG